MDNLHTNKGVDEGPVAPSVFKTVERRMTSLVGSTPMHSRHFLLAAVLFLLLGVTACSDSEALPPRDTKASPQTFEDIAGAKKLYSKEVASPEVRERGAELFRQTVVAASCAGCHSTSPGEIRVTAPNLSGVFAVYSARFGGPVEAKAWLHNKILHSDKIKGVNSTGWSMEMPLFEGAFEESDVVAIVEWLAARE